MRYHLFIHVKYSKALPGSSLVYYCWFTVSGYWTKNAIGFEKRVQSPYQTIQIYVVKISTVKFPREIFNDLSKDCPPFKASPYITFSFMEMVFFIYSSYPSLATEDCLCILHHTAIIKNSYAAIGMCVLWLAVTLI